MKIRLVHKPSAVFWLTWLCLLGPSRTTDSENFTLTTTYPAPIARHGRVQAASAVVLIPQSSPPSNALKGSLYYDRESKNILQYDGSSWTAAGGSSLWSASGNNIYDAGTGSVITGGTLPKATMTVYGPLYILGNMTVDGQSVKK